MFLLMKTKRTTLVVTLSFTIFSMKKATLGSFIKDKNKEHLLNAIMRQADREGLSTTLTFPNRKKWLLKNISIWFCAGGVLAE
jgi:hypothetical protein